MAKKTNKNKGVSVEQECNLYRRILPMQKHDPGSEVCLVIDGMSFAHTAYHAYNKLSYRKKSVSMIFGVPQILKRYVNLYKPTKIVICWDGMRSERRNKWLPEYKSHREKTRDPRQRRLFEKQIGRLKSLLYYMGIPQAYNEKVEGDDMVYLVTKRESLLRQVVIVSGDKDMLQMVNWDVRVVNIRSGTVHDATNFSLMDPYVRIDQIVDYISLVGDTSDDIPGIKGIGPSKASGFLRLYNSWEDYMKDEEAYFTGVMNKDKANKIMKRNRKMIDIIWYCSKFHKKKHWLKYYKSLSLPSWNEELYVRFCTKWGLKTMLLPQFKKSFQI